MSLKRPSIPAQLARSLFQVRHYRAAIVALRIVRRPISFLMGYAFGAGKYPTTIEIKTPNGVISLDVRSWHDLRTIHEIFCAGDYRVDSCGEVIVDFGSNIGISAAYFLSRNPNSFIYLFEPLPTNVETLKVNMQRQFPGRYALEETAVGLEDGRLEFGWEATGRLGGLGMKTGKYISVDVRKSTDLLAQIIGMHGKIDVLKVDIETMEKEITESISIEQARRIHTIFVECPFEANPLLSTHDMKINGTVSCFVRRTTQAA
jgi:FkbM family methyltransferase